MISKVYDRLSIAAGLPWLVAFSGGKDSTAVLDLAYRFGRDNCIELAVLHNEELLKPPPVFQWVCGVRRLPNCGLRKEVLAAWAGIYVVGKD